MVRNASMDGSEMAGAGGDSRQPPLILASSSPRRAALLRLIGVPFEVLASAADEELEPRDDAAEYVVAVATAKARSVAALLPAGLVVAADTLILVDGQLLGKPKDMQDAARMLARMRGRSVSVFTGVVVMEAIHSTYKSSTVASVLRMRRYSDNEAAQYLASGEAKGKAGGLAVQGNARALIESISGCYSNVLGLPVCELPKLLNAVPSRHDGFGRPVISVTAVEEYCHNHCCPG